MEKNGLSKEAKERIKRNINKEIEHREAIYEQLSKEDREALRLGRRALMKKEAYLKIKNWVRKIFRKH